MSGITPSIEIQVYENGKLLAERRFQQDKIILGRILSADLRIPSMRVSRIHALIENLDDGNYRITDLASTHGTFVNGERVVDRILRPGDEVKLADVELKLSFEIQPTLTAIPTPQTAPKVPAASAPASSEPSAEGPSSSEIQLGPQGEAQSVIPVREATVIRSLKETARTRGALDPTSKPHEELELTVYWEETILAIEHYRGKKRNIYIGDGLESEHIVPVNEFPNRFLFVELKGHCAVLHLHPAMKASVRSKGQMFTNKDLASMGQNSIELAGTDIAKVQVGNVHFFVMFVPEPPKIPMAPFFDQGKLWWGTLSLVVFLALAFAVLGIVFKPPIEGQVKEFPEKFRKIIVQAYKKKQEPVKPLEAKSAQQGSNAKAPQQKVVKGGDEAQGAKEQGDAGKRGTKAAKVDKGITNRPKVAEKTKTQDAKKVAKKPVKKITKKQPRKPIKKPTLLDSLKNSGLGARLSKAANEDAGAAGQDRLKEAFQGAGGGGVRSGRGSGGSGLQGAGSGGGGKAVGVGGLGTSGFGGGARGSGAGSIPGKGEATVGTESVGVSVVGSLTREEIERVIQAHLNEVRYCYQKELQRNPSVAGKITLKWTIVSGGLVTGVSTRGNTTGSSRLANCMKSRLKSWRFPAPRGGSKAEVDYPWVFKPQGS